MTTDTLSQGAIQDGTDRTRTNQMEQYTLWQILGIWASAALPMGLIMWVVVPLLIPHVDMEPGFLFFNLITLGLVWQGVIAYLILRREVRPFTWANIKDRLWLHTPSDLRTGARSNRSYLWIIPLIVFSQAYYALEVLGGLDELWVKTFPFLAPRPYAVIQNVAELIVGQWWLLGVLAVTLVFNYLLGEELIFRGILLPKMNGVFGRWDWIANGILFSTYHLHRIWGLPSTLFIDWIYPWAAKRFRSYWVAVILHAVDGVILVVLFPMAILGLLG